MFSLARYDTSNLCCVSVESTMPKRFFSLNEAVAAILESDSDGEVDVCILPPNDGADSECEHVDENDLLPSEPADVCGEVDVFGKKSTRQVRKTEKNAKDDANSASEVSEERSVRKRKPIKHQETDKGDTTTTGKTKVTRRRQVKNNKTPSSRNGTTNSEHEDENDLLPSEPADVCGRVEVIGNKPTRHVRKRERNADDATEACEVSEERPVRKSKRMKQGMQQATDKADTSMTDMIMATPQAQVKKNAPRATSKASENAQKSWRKTDKYSNVMCHATPPVLADSNPQLTTMIPLQLFEVLFTDAMFEHLKVQFELYASRDLNIQSFDTDTDEIRKFLGIILLSGYNALPMEQDYWSTADDMGCKAVARAMPKNRFLELKRCCHIADNMSLTESRVAKVKPLYDQLNQSLMQFGIFDQRLSIDESVVPYYGHHGAKMFIRGKPIRFGYKIWMLTSQDGYPYQADIYCGKSSSRPPGVPLGEHVVMEFAELIADKSCHELYFDNFFSSYSLISKLRQMNLKATGTVREGRTGTAPLKGKKHFDKKDRGEYDFTCDGSVCLVRWSDNNVVTCISNFDSVNPVKKVMRHVKGKDGKVSVSQPLMIANYTSGMGGVDLLDRLLAAYRPRIKGKKWWWNLFIHSVNIAVVAAWRLHCRVTEASATLNHLQFRREVSCN